MKLRAIIGLILSCFILSAAAQYPSRPIRVVVTIPPGGAPDIAARIIGQKLSDAMGQPVVVENRPGANGNTAADSVAKATADGYTLLLAADSLITINPHLYARMPIDTLKDLAPVASLVANQFVLSVNPALPVKSFQEFIDYARKASPPLNYASGGNGSQHQLTMEMLKARAGIDLLHVPFKGGGPATVAILAGDVSVMFGGNSVAGHIKSGKLRALAVAGKKRSASYPDLPRLSELYPDLEVTPWLALFAPSATPPGVMARLRAETNRLLGHEDLVGKIRNVGGLEPYVTTPEEFAAQLRAEHAKYGQIVKAVGARID
jgi:tripartite-type tricarboxylate transporter receptor subunit TctC